MVPIVDMTDMVERFEDYLERIPYVHEHMMTRWERKVLVALTASFDRGGPMFEFGTWRGLTTKVLSVTTGKEIYTLDCPDLKENSESTNSRQLTEILSTEEIGIECRGDPNVRQLLMDSFKFEPAAEMLNVMDVVLVDGNHTYKYVSKDVENARKMLRVGGLLLVHDYDSRLPDGTTLSESQSADVIRFVREQREPWWSIKDTAFAFTIKRT